MGGSPASLEGEEYYIEVSVVRKGVTQRAAQGRNRQQQPMGSVEQMNELIHYCMDGWITCLSRRRGLLYRSECGP